MTAEQKLEVLKAVKHSCLPKELTLKNIGIAPSTYYRWQVRRGSSKRFYLNVPGNDRRTGYRKGL